MNLRNDALCYLIIKIVIYQSITPEWAQSVQLYWTIQWKPISRRVIKSRLCFVNQTQIEPRTRYSIVIANHQSKQHSSSLEKTILYTYTDTHRHFPTQVPTRYHSPRTIIISFIGRARRVPHRPPINFPSEYKHPHSKQSGGADGGDIKETRCRVRGGRAPGVRRRQKRGRLRERGQRASARVTNDVVCPLRPRLHGDNEQVPPPAGEAAG